MSNRPRTGDPLLDEIDGARRRILADCDNDPEKVLEFYMEYQKQFADRLVDYSNETRLRPNGGACKDGEDERA
jgi:hypothetical protein